jgi:hypothetical protein
MLAMAGEKGKGAGMRINYESLTLWFYSEGGGEQPTTHIDLHDRRVSSSRPIRRHAHTTPDRPLEKHIVERSAIPPNRPWPITGKRGCRAETPLWPDKAQEFEDWLTEGLVATLGTYIVRGRRGWAR